MKRVVYAALFLIAASAPSHAECADEIKAMMQATMAAGPYHAVIDQVAGGKTRQMNVDVVLPSSFHVKSDEMEAVMLKDGTWIKTGGTWQALPAAVAGVMTSKLGDAIKQGMNSDLSKLKNMQCLGPQAIEGKTLPAYSFDSSAQVMGMAVSSHMMMYKDDQGRPSIMQIDGSVMGKATKTVEHITYDPSITVTAPK